MADIALPAKYGGFEGSPAGAKLFVRKSGTTAPWNEVSEVPSVNTRVILYESLTVLAFVHDEDSTLSAVYLAGVASVIVTVLVLLVSRATFLFWAVPTLYGASWKLVVGFTALVIKPLVGRPL